MNMHRPVITVKLIVSFLKLLKGTTLCLAHHTDERHLCNTSAVAVLGQLLMTGGCRGAGWPRPPLWSQHPFSVPSFCHTTRTFVRPSPSAKGFGRTIAHSLLPSSPPKPKALPALSSQKRFLHYGIMERGWLAAGAKGD